jgi:twinkle protein
MELPRKDANEMLVDGMVKEFVTAFWEAREYRPDGIVRLADIRERILTPPEMGLPWWLESLSKVTYGRRLGETYAFGAGTGIGKTDFLTQQIQYDVDVLGEKVGLFFLEQSPSETAKRVANKFAGKRFHVPMGAGPRTSWSRSSTGSRPTTASSSTTTSAPPTGTSSRASSSTSPRPTASGIFYLDHLTALAAAEEDERKALERIMADMAQLAKALNVIIHFVSHLATPDGKPHEEGGRVMIRHFKGSRAIGFWSHFMFGLERDTQAEDDAVKTITTFRVLKDRYTGTSTGKTFQLGYDSTTGLLSEDTSSMFDEVSSPF